jgi:hypothetical protein
MAAGGAELERGRRWRRLTALGKMSNRSSRGELKALLAWASMAAGRAEASHYKPPPPYSNVYMCC